MTSMITFSDIIKATISSLETGQNDGLFVDFKPRSDGQFECITVQSVRDIISKVTVKFLYT